MGIGKTPPVYLKSGDEITISITGLGALTNKVAAATASNYTTDRVASQTSFELINASKSIGGKAGMTQINSKPLHYQRLGSGDDHIVFVHGLGGALEYWKPLVSSLSLADTHSCHLFDLEGHGLSPTHPLSELTIASFAADLKGVFEHKPISDSNPATIIAHSMGCLVALRFTLENPKLVKKLVLMGPPPSPVSETASQSFYTMAQLVRTKGMSAIADTLVSADTSKNSQKSKPLAIAAVRLSLLSQDPESYAKACWALAKSAEELQVQDLDAETLLITGDEDQVSSPELCESYVSRIKKSKLAVLEKVGHWHVFEDVEGVADAVKLFL